MSVATISLTDMRSVVESGKPICLVDVRTPAEYAGVHAAGAKLLPLDTMDPAVVSAQRKDSDEALYVICQSGSRAAKACEKLAAAGVEHVFCVEGGTAAWQRAGLPIERGQSRVISLERQVRIGAGSLVVLGLALGWFMHPVFLLLSAFVGCGLVFAGVTDYCGMGMLLAKMPWNREARCSAT
jgi:rhodanese-related sulfurtransferase